MKIRILGGGIMGLLAARALVVDGHDITVYDPLGFPARNASHMAGGMLAPYSEIEHMDMRWVQAGLTGVALWRDIDQGLAGDTGFEAAGSLLIAHADDRYILERFRAHLPQGIQHYQCVEGVEPCLHPLYQDGVFLADEAHLNPVMTMRALCDDLSGKVELCSESSDIDAGGDDWVIDCRGMGAKDPDIRGVKGEVLIVRNDDFTLARPVRLMHPRYPLYIIPRGDGVFMIGATIIESSDNQNVSLRSSMELMSALYALSPSFADAQILEISAGIRPSYADNLPRVDVRGHVISCNGLFRHGYLLSPVMAQCVADYIAGRDNADMELMRKDHHACDSERAA